MIDVLLTHSYFMMFDRKQWRNMQPYPPLGTLYAASVLREAGLKVALFDSMLSGSEDELSEYIRTYSPKIVAIYDDSFNYLTKMCLSRMRTAAYQMLDIVKSRGIVSVVFSPDSVNHADDYLAHGADFVIKGEGEETLLELCTSVLRGDRLTRVPGTIQKRGGHLYVDQPRGLIKDLDRLPFPAWDLVDVERYKMAWEIHGYFSMNMVTTRGCPFGCNWCAKPIYGRSYHSRSPRNVVEEMTFLKQHYNPDHIWFCDDIFGLRPGWLEEFAAEVENAGLSLRYKCLSRPDLLVKENSFNNLSRSGCETVWLGVESGSQAVLDAMEKGTTVEQARIATKKLKECDMRVGYFLQFGYPGESYLDIKKTMSLLKEESPDEIGISVSYPLPDTAFYSAVKNKLGDKLNWYDSDDLALLFPGEFKPSFYRALHRLIHSSHRLRRILSRAERISIRTALAFLFNAAVLPYFAILVRLRRKKNPNRIVSQPEHQQ